MFKKLICREVILILGLSIWISLTLFRWLTLYSMVIESFLKGIFFIFLIIFWFFVISKIPVLFEEWVNKYIKDDVREIRCLEKLLIFFILIEIIFLFIKVLWFSFVLSGLFTISLVLAGALLRPVLLGFLKEDWTKIVLFLYKLVLILFIASYIIPLMKMWLIYINNAINFSSSGIFIHDISDVVLILIILWVFIKSFLYWNKKYIKIFISFILFGLIPFFILTYWSFWLFAFKILLKPRVFYEYLTLVSTQLNYNIFALLSRFIATFFIYPKLIKNLSKEWIEAGKYVFITLLMISLATFSFIVYTFSEGSSLFFLVAGLSFSTISIGLIFVIYGKIINVFKKMILEDI